MVNSAVAYPGGASVAGFLFKGQGQLREHTGSSKFRRHAEAFASFGNVLFSFSGPIGCGSLFDIVFV
ncbi:MAG: hypothetical protein KIT46_00780 [Anaerolineales bacterium]|nr:hypothetical protein [Anaerolineales bacterium]MCW5854557.1 hypothetical protein [Anaerolineales bacterium]